MSASCENIYIRSSITGVDAIQFLGVTYYQYTVYYAELDLVDPRSTLSKHRTSRVKSGHGTGPNVQPVTSPSAAPTCEAATEMQPAIGTEAMLSAIVGP